MNPASHLCTILLKNFSNMGLVIFLQCFHDHESAGMPRDSVRKIFSPFVKESEPDFWSVQYDAKNFCTLFLEPFDEDNLHQIALEQPCDDSRLWDSLAALLCLGNVILYTPEGSVPLVGHEGVTQHLPRELLQSLGNPVVVRNGHEIRAVVQSRWKPTGSDDNPKD